MVSPWPLPYMFFPSIQLSSHKSDKTTGFPKYFGLGILSYDIIVKRVRLPKLQQFGKVFFWTWLIFGPGWFLNAVYKASTRSPTLARDSIDILSVNQHLIMLSQAAIVSRFGCSCMRCKECHGWLDMMAWMRRQVSSRQEMSTHS